MKRITTIDLITASTTPYALSYSIDHVVKELTSKLKAHLRANGGGQTYEIVLNVKEPNVSE